MDFIDEYNLDQYFIEIGKYSEDCKFTGCKHYKEPKCAVKEAVEKNEISKSRYDNYIAFLTNIMERSRY